MAQNIIAKHGLDVALGLSDKSKSKFYNDLTDLLKDAGKKTEQEFAQSLANAMDEMFKSAGKKSPFNVADIVSVEGFGKQIANELIKGMSEGMKGVSIGTGLTDELSKRLESLKAERKSLVEEEARLRAQIKNKTRIEKLNAVDPFDAEPLKIDGDVTEAAEKLLDKLYSASEKISSLQDKNKTETKEYVDAVLAAQELYNDFYRMQKTLKNTQAPISKDLRARYDAFKSNNDQDNYYNSGGQVEAFDLTEAGDTIAYAFEDLSEVIDVSTDLEKIENSLKRINAEIEEITKQANVAKSTGISALEGVLKEEKEIEEARKRMLTKKGNTYSVKGVKDLNAVVGDEPAQIKDSLEKLRFGYDKSVADEEGWEVQYQWLVKFVNKYDELQAKGKNKDQLANFKDVYDSFMGQYPEALASLKALRDVIDDTPASKGKVSTKVHKSDEDIDKAINDIFKDDDVDNANKIAEANRKAAEEAERKAKADREAAEAAEKARLAKEAEAEATRKAIEMAEKEKAILLEQKELLEQLTKLSNETGAFYNSKTGEHTPVKEGEKHQVKTTLGDWKSASQQYDTRIHKHNYDVAAPSGIDGAGDFTTWIKGFEYIKKQMIIANSEILSFDFSSLTKEVLQSIADSYHEAAQKIDQEFDSVIKSGKMKETYGSWDGLEEAMQVKLRQALETIMQQFPGVMQSYKIPSATSSVSSSANDVGDTSSVELKAIQDEANRLREEKAILQSDLNVADEQIKLANNGRVQAESESLKKDETIRELQDNLDRANSDFTEARNKQDAIIEDLKKQLANVQTAPKVGDGVGTADIDAETTQFKTLRETIEAVTTAVNQKTQAFYNEGQIVGQVVGKEVNAVKALDSQVGEVNAKISALLANVQTVVATANKSKGFNINVKTTAESTHSKSKGETSKKDDEPKRKQTDLNQLIKKHEELGRLYARLDDDNEVVQSGKIEALELELKHKEASLNLTKDEIALLKEKEKIAEEAEEIRVRGEKEQKAIDKQKEAVAKAEKEAAKASADAQKKAEAEAKKLENQKWNDEKRSARANKGANYAGTAVTSGNKIVNEVVGNEKVSDEVESAAKKLRTEINTLDQLRNDTLNLIRGGNFDAIDSEGLLEQSNKVNKLTEELRQMWTLHEKYSGDNAKSIVGDIGEFDGLELEDYQRRLTEMAEASVNGKLRNVQFNASTRELTGTVKTGANTFTTYSFAVDKVDGAIKQLNSGSKRTESFFEGITRKTKELAQYAIGSISVYDVFNQLRQGVQYIREIDSALVELRKVTDETEESYARFIQTASETGAKIGSTISDFTRATATFAKLGYDMNMASEMAEAAVVYQNVGDQIESADAAAESIISTIKGFGLEASESMRIVDRFNEVGEMIAQLCSNVWCKVAQNGEPQEIWQYRG